MYQFEKKIICTRLLFYFWKLSTSTILFSCKTSYNFYVSSYRDIEYIVPYISKKTETIISEESREVIALQNKFPRQNTPYVNFVCVADIVESRVILGNYKHCEANNYYYCLPHYPYRQVEQVLPRSL